MNRVFFSILTIIAAASTVALGTGAFFSDTERSTGNVFAAGIIDLKIDNESYYNGAVSTSTTWLTPADLDDGRLFFNFTDLKPDDEGEDTISIHIGTNDAWACMDLTLTSDDDRSSNEPELGTGDAPEDINDTWDGELADNLNFVWWADDGDNVLETGENILSDGVQTLTDLATTSGPFTVALADSENNAWGLPTGTPIAANSTVYVGKAWCFGTLTPSPVPQDGLSTSGPLDGRGTGVLCDGTSLGNETQTDGATVDIAFRAFQARNVENFTCEGEKPRVATITVVKQLVLDNGGNEGIADFQLVVDNGTTEIGVTSGIPTNVAAGNYFITEVGVPGYVASFSGDCDADGSIALAPGDNKTCTITNNDLPANITLKKVVINNNGGNATEFSAWGLKIDGVTVPSSTSFAVTANSSHIITETGRPGYAFSSMTGTSSYGKPCPAALGGSITLDEGETIVCTITNDDI